MVAYVTRIPSGFVGQVTRLDYLVATPEIIDPNTPPTAFGAFVKVVAGKIQPLASGDLATVIYGLLINSFPATSTSTAVGTPATPPTSGILDVLRRGFMAVKLANGTAAKNGTVYVRTTASSGHFVGDIEAALDPIATAAAGTNTGNGTIGTVTPTAAALTGVYVAKMTAATAFTVYDPSGYALGTGATGVAYNQGGVGFTITAGGTPFVAGDSFNITVTQRTVPVAGTTFTGPADVNGIVEVAVKL